MTHITPLSALSIAEYQALGALVLAGPGPFEVVLGEAEQGLVDKGMLLVRSSSGGRALCDLAPEVTARADEIRAGLAALEQRGY